MIEDYLEQAIKNYKLRFPELQRTDEEIVDYILPKLNSFLEHFGHLTTSELRKKPSFIQCEAYDLGFLTSRVYTKAELERKKGEYLAMMPLPSSGKTVDRWYYEVERQFRSKTIDECPDKVFLMLDTFRKIGSPC